MGGKSILHRNGSAVKRSYRDSRYELLRSIGHAALLHIIYCCALVSTLPHEKTAYSVSRPFTFLDTLHALLFFFKEAKTLDSSDLRSPGYDCDGNRRTNLHNNQTYEAQPIHLAFSK